MPTTRNGQASKRLDDQPSKQLVIFDGFSRPTWTQVPDEVFDVLLPVLSDDELRVLLYVIRHTFGWKKEQDDISLSQFVHGIRRRDGTAQDHGCGVSKAGAARGIKQLVERGVLVCQRNRHPEKGNLPTTYRLRFKGDPLVSTGDNPMLTMRLPLSPDGATLVSPVDPQETPPQHTNGQQALPTETNRDADELARFWESVKVELAMQMSKANYETWFRETELLSLDGDVAVIQAPNPFTAEWLQTRCVPLLRKTVAAIAQRPVECQVVVRMK